ncbi:MAG: flavin reductase family protein [Paracoccaceae bacterium]
MTQFDKRALRDAFGSFMTGVTIVTARAADGTPVGFTANSFSSVSLDPPLLLVCPGKFLSSFQTFADCTHFAVNILAEGQEDISNTFATFKGDRFAQAPHQIGAHNLPLIDGALAQFCCTTHQAIPAGDHVILIGKVTDFSHTDTAGLGYTGGRYFSLGLERESRSSAPAICGAIIEGDGQVLLEKHAQGYRPVQAEGAKTGAHVDRLSAALNERGIPADITQVYSSYTDEGTGEVSTYFLATTPTLTQQENHEWVPISALSSLPYYTSAIRHMMTRYALEAETRNFALYLGDAVQGDIHPLS